MGRDYEAGIRETWWRWRDNWVHVDRIEHPDARAKVVILHGGAGYSRTVLPYARVLGTQPVDVVMPDLPGFGLTKSKGRGPSYQCWIECVADLLRQEQHRDELPVILFGVSMGGLLAYTAACRVPVLAVFATSLLDPRLPPVREDVSRWPALGNLVDKISDRSQAFDSLAVPVALLSDPTKMTRSAEVNRLTCRNSQGRPSRIGWRFLRTYLASPCDVAPEDYTGAPVTLMYPEDDRLASVKANLAFFDRLPPDRRRFVRLPQASHLPVENSGLVEMEQAFSREMQRLDEMRVGYTPRNPELNSER
jgi:alpha-beta hydrolase superfamily lysophospholipase